MGNGCCGCCGSKTTGTTPPKNGYQPTLEDNVGKRRFTDLAITNNDPNKLLEGYDKGPLHTLEEALEPFHGRIDQLPERIKEAKTKCYFPSKHKLTKDESAAIYIYTMNWSRTCVYDQLQGALKRGDQAEIKRWFKYIKLFKTGLDKLPDAKGIVWQATEYDDRKKQLLISDEQPLFITLGSCSPSDNDLKQNIGGRTSRKKILIGYGPFIKAKDITGYTADNYQEFIVFPGAKVGKPDVNSDSDGTIYIHYTRRYKQYPQASSPPQTTQTQKHFACPFNGCRNRCPADHEGTHCHSFATLAHSCEHHCNPGCYQCYKCKQLTNKLCQCYKCGTAYCENCCFR